MFCKNCGAENDAEAKFCKSCGQSLVEEQPQAPGFDSSQSTNSTGNSNSTGTGQGQERSMYKYNYNSGDSDATVALIVGIISIVMCSSSLLGIGLGIFAIIMANKAKKQGSTSGSISAGQICGVIGICLSGIATLYYIFAFILGIASAIA